MYVGTNDTWVKSVPIYDSGQAAMIAQILVAQKIDFRFSYEAGCVSFFVEVEYENRRALWDAESTTGRIFN